LLHSTIRLKQLKPLPRYFSQHLTELNSANDLGSLWDQGPAYDLSKDDLRVVVVLEADTIVVTLRGRATRSAKLHDTPWLVAQSVLQHRGLKPGMPAEPLRPTLNSTGAVEPLILPGRAANSAALGAPHEHSAKS
jgi:hypothetical protein